MLRRLASRFKSSITGSAPVPVPTTRRRHFHGIFSARDSGVCPNWSRNFLDGFFLRLLTSPRSITTSWFVDDAINANRPESKGLKTHNPSLRQLYSATVRPPQRVRGRKSLIGASSVVGKIGIGENVEAGEVLPRQLVR